MVGVAGSEVRTLGIGPDRRKIRQDLITSLRKGKPDLKADAPVDISAKDFNDLASQLGA